MTSTSGAPAAERLDDPELFSNRELSWLDFNDRVLQIAENPATPLLERVRFCSIYSNNLDEFFMIRVAGLHDQLDAGIDARGADGLAPDEVIDGVRTRVLAQTDRLEECLAGLRPELAEHGIRLCGWDELDDDGRQELCDRFHRQIFPVLTPLAVGLGRPFPYISNLSLSLAVLVRDPVTDHRAFARVKVPKEMLPRFLPVGGGKGVHVALEDVISANIQTLFPGMEIVDHGTFRVTRDGDFTVSDEADDLLQAVETQLRRRRFGEVVRVEVSRGIDPKLRRQLADALEVEDREVYEVDGPLDLADLDELADLPGRAGLKWEPWTSLMHPRLVGDGNDEVDVFAAIRDADILLHHPYDTFGAVERFVAHAVEDPAVLAIKQTVYRTSDDSPLVPALIRATERGKQAACVVEIKARGDERANIQWARALEQSGVHVVYGDPALKTHAKCILVVRREGDGIRNYLHIGTGNYHPKTARLYTDFGLLTCSTELGDDMADMFNFLTGFARPGRNRKALVAPYHLRDGILEQIEATITAHEDGRHARIAMKMNSIVDPACIRALYRASQAGVEVALNLRGICCLRPGVEGVSENIRVVSVVGRFLEHSRIFSFERGDEKRIFIGSADLMPRNLDTRVELVAPVEDPALCAELLDVLERCLDDTQDAWELGPDGTWEKLDPGEEPRSVQRELMGRHAARAAEARAATST